MLVESEFQNVTSGAQTWRYNDSGQGEPVVLFHGFPDTPHSYAGIARALNGSGYRTVLPYLRGYHPDTMVKGRPYDALHLAGDAIGLLDAPMGTEELPSPTAAHPSPQQLESRVHEIGREAAGTTDPRARTALYSELLATCAACHAAVGAR